MQILRFAGENGFQGGSVIAIGFFDGVHIAHRALIERAREEARSRSLALGILTFSSESGIKPDSKRIYTTEQRLGLLSDMGVDFAVVCDFADISDIGKEEFVRHVLIEKYGARLVVAGYNFRFGKGAAGNAQVLLTHFGADNTIILPPQTTSDGRRIASTEIRDMITRGDVDKAALMLGRPWALRAKVYHGKHLGSSWGFPTANQYFPTQSVIPARGVYAVRCTVDGKSYDGVANVGLRPTVDGRDARVNCETYLFNFSGDLYGKVLHTAFYAYLRPEQKFEDADALRAAIAHDAAAARTYFENFH